MHISPATWNMCHTRFGATEPHATRVGPIGARAPCNPENWLVTCGSARAIEITILITISQGTVCCLWEWDAWTKPSTPGPEINCAVGRFSFAIPWISFPSLSRGTSLSSRHAKDSPGR